jgi:Fic family protein
MSTNVRSTSNDVVRQRIYNEFLEMPGLRVTCQQAQRLWGLDRQTCLDVLDTLVDAGFLARTGRGMYARLTDGHAEYPRPHDTRRG